MDKYITNTGIRNLIGAIDESFNVRVLYDDKSWVFRTPFIDKHGFLYNPDNGVVSGQIDFEPIAPITMIPPTIDRIIVNKKKRATTVIWADGDVTVVKRAKGDRDEPYFAVASALAIKCYGSNSAFKSLIDNKLEYTKNNK